ncbi:MAG: hypothetical protein HYV07_23265 [Deltaproteobacteria bacterium]|nr:hypothetical protein [Deltaproteobacteria bacterium]
MSVRRSDGARPPVSHGAAEQTTHELKARNAAGKQAKAAKLAQYQRPHRVHSEQEEQIAHARKRALELLESAEQYAVEDEQVRLQRADELEEEENRLKGLNLDERRKKRGQRDSEGEEDDDDQGEEAAKSLGFTEGTGKFFQDAPEDRMGDLSLNNPEDMKRILGPSVRFAQHAMLLAEDRLKSTASRQDAISYLASLYVGLTDNAYANKALRDFGPGTGVVDLYPLEVIKHLLEHVPAFITKISTAKFFANVPKEGYEGVAGEPILLRYPQDLRIRGFAIVGGDKPGYLFEPTDPPGTYLLTIGQPGTYTVMVSALARGGMLSIEEFPVRVTPGRGKTLEASEVVKKVRSAFVDADGTSAEEKPKKKKDEDLKVVIPRRI